MQLGEERGGWWEPETSVWITEERGSSRESWSLGAAGLIFGLGHPPNTGLPGQTGANIPNTKAMLFLMQHSQKGLGMNMFSRKKKKKKREGEGVGNPFCITFAFI